MGLSWPYADLMLVLIAAWVCATSFVCVVWLKKLRSTNNQAHLLKIAEKPHPRSRAGRIFRAALDFIKDFVIADEWISAVVLWVLVIGGSLLTLDTSLWPSVILYFTFVLPFGLRKGISLKN